MYTKRFNEKVCEFIKHFTWINNLNNLFNNNKNNMESIIMLGHYQTNNSLNSEKAEIIRIIGPDKEKDGNWITQDKKSIPTYILEQEYTFLDTIPTAGFKANKPPISIFAGLTELSDSEQNEKQNITEDYNQAVKPIYTKEITLQVKPKIIETPISFDISVLDKISIDSLNKKAFEKLGIEKYKKPIIQIPLDIELNYDISKIKQTIDLLDLDQDTVLNYIVNSIDLNDIKPLIKLYLYNFINMETSVNKVYEKTTEITEKILDSSKAFNTIPTLEVSIIDKSKIDTSSIYGPGLNHQNVPFLKEIEEKTIEKEIIEQGISEIEKYLTNNFK
jgi:hypothetical protein